MKSRRSVRDFENKPVPEDLINKLLLAFDSAPQAGGNRGRRCLMIDNPRVIADLAERGHTAYQDWLKKISSPLIRETLEEYGANFFWFKNAPLLAVSIIRRPPAFLAEDYIAQEAGLIWGGHFSASMAVMSLLLAAASLGLGACCLGGPLIVPKALESILGLNGREQISLLAALGYPNSPQNP
jgi:nitroreductase